LAAAVHTLRLELLSTFRELGRLEIKAHEAGPDHPATWGALALACREQSKALAELEVLEAGTAAEVLRLVLAGRPVQAPLAPVAPVISPGG
jgi:hypothetical protein